jgi:hypothetical protein
MTKTALLKKLEAMLTTAENERMWGNLEIEIRDGIAVLVRKSSTEKLDGTIMEKTRGSYASNNR